VVALSLLPAAARAGGDVRIKVGADAAEFLVGDELVTRYHFKGYDKPIFWPVFAPGHLRLTRDWPMVKDAKGQSTDHVHQRSAWFVHGDVIPDGVELKHKIRGVEGVDFWSEAPGHGKIVCTAVKALRTGDPHHAALQTKNEWQTADGTKVLDETRTIHFYDLGKARLIVLDIDLAADVSPITFGDTKEGAMGVRVNDVIRADKVGKGKIQNAEGKVGEKEAWGRISDWCDYSGPVDGKTVGLTLMADPKNAQPSAWHVRGYGLMAANPFGRTRAAFPDTKGKKELVHLNKGDHLRLRYGMLLHAGDAEAGQVAEQYRRFVELRAKE
jgi:hypothetical protein